MSRGLILKRHEAVSIDSPQVSTLLASRAVIETGLLRELRKTGAGALFCHNPWLMVCLEPLEYERRDVFTAWACLSRGVKVSWWIVRT